MIISDRLIERLKKANTIGILTGAGVSAESGVATFRDPDGLWSKFNPMELASVDGFMGNQKLVWEWYQYRVDIVRNTKPNPGHDSIAELQKIKNTKLITQNVDRLHHRAGAKDVIELHGNIVTNRCFDCGKQHEEEIEASSKELPACNFCGGRIRPNVVWFGEMLPPNAIQEAELIAYQSDVFFSIGTSAEVYPAANLPIIAKDNGAYVVEINPNKTVISNYMDEFINAPSGEAMPEILKKLKIILEK